MQVQQREVLRGEKRGEQVDISRNRAAHPLAIALLHHRLLTELSERFRRGATMR